MNDLVVEKVTKRWRASEGVLLTTGKENRLMEGTGLARVDEKEECSVWCMGCYTWLMSGFDHQSPRRGYKALSSGSAERQICPLMMDD